VEAPPPGRGRQPGRQGAHTRREQGHHGESPKYHTRPRPVNHSHAGPVGTPAGFDWPDQKLNSRVYLTMNDRPSRALSRSSPR
jgi:hypothetical protein